MSRKQSRYDVIVYRSSDAGLSRMSRSFTNKKTALAYAKRRRNATVLFDNKTQTRLYASGR